MRDSDYQKIFDRVNRAVAAIPSRVATLAVNFSKERFRQKNWYDKTPKPWKKTEKRKGSTLVASSTLMKSIHKISVTPTQIIIGTDVPYARAHNEGMEIQGTEQVKKHNRRAHRRRAHTRKGRRIKATTVKSYTVEPYSRKYHRKFEKRQFIGTSQELTQRIDELISNEINRAIQSPNK